MLGFDPVIAFCLRRERSRCKCPKQSCVSVRGAGRALPPEPPPSTGMEEQLVSMTCGGHLHKTIKQLIVYSKGQKWGWWCGTQWGCFLVSQFWFLSGSNLVREPSEKGSTAELVVSVGSWRRMTSLTCGQNWALLLYTPGWVFCFKHLGRGGITFQRATQKKCISLCMGNLTFSSQSGHINLGSFTLLPLLQSSSADFCAVSIYSFLDVTDILLDLLHNTRPWNFSQYSV